MYKYVTAQDRHAPDAKNEKSGTSAALPSLRNPRQTIFGLLAYALDGHGAAAIPLGQGPVKHVSGIGQLFVNAGIVIPESKPGFGPIAAKIELEWVGMAFWRGRRFPSSVRIAPCKDSITT